MDPNIFKAYDIRGIYPDDLDEEAAYWIGRAFVHSFKLKKIPIGIDMRESSPKLEESFIKGALDQGSDVIKIGLSTTPMVYFSSTSTLTARWQSARLTIHRSGTGDVGAFDGYEPLVAAIMKFFQTGIAPVKPDETIEIFAFMEAADESKRQGGAPVKVKDIIKQAKARK